MAVAYINRPLIGSGMTPPLVITARVVVWPDRKIMGPKVYGSDAHLLRMLLEDEGYELNKDGFHGARLLKLCYPKEHCFIVPYIDRQKVLLTMEGELLCHREGMEASSTNGIMKSYPPFKSDKSGIVFFSHKEHKVIVWLEDGIKQTWAKCELTKDMYRCMVTGHYFKTSYRAPVPSDTWWKFSYGK